MNPLGPNPWDGVVEAARQYERSLLRTLFRVRLAATLAWLVGYIAAVAITVLGFVKMWSDDAGMGIGFGLMLLGTSLSLLMGRRLDRVRNRFEDISWSLIKTHAGPASDEERDGVVNRQAGGDDVRTAAVRVRRVRQLRKGLVSTIGELWPKPPVANLEQDWTQDGTFADHNGTRVRCYDDVALLEPTGSEPDSNGSIIMLPAGTSGTVLFFTTGEPCLLELEYEVDGMVLGVVEASKTKLHLRNEEKYLSQR